MLTILRILTNSVRLMRKIVCPENNQRHASRTSSENGSLSSSGILVSTKQPPRFPRAIRTSSSRYVIFCQPLAFFPSNRKGTGYGSRKGTGSRDPPSHLGRLSNSNHPRVNAIFSTQPSVDITCACKFRIAPSAGRRSTRVTTLAGGSEVRLDSGPNTYCSICGATEFADTTAR